MMDSDIEFAKQDPALAIASLFRPVTRGRRPGGLEYRTYFDDIEIHWAIWRALDSRDQSVLLAVIGLAGVEHDELDTENDAKLWKELEPKEAAKDDRAIITTTTRYKLLQAAGLNQTGGAYGVLEDCLKRLGAVTCHAFSNGNQWSMNFLSYEKTSDGQVRIALNSRFAEALTGQHSRIQLTERRELHSEPAQIMHAWLSAWIRPGKTRHIYLDTLASNVWGKESTSASTQTNRRVTINKALQDLNQISAWTVKTTGRGKQAKATITRARIIEHSD